MAENQVETDVAKFTERQEIIAKNPGLIEQVREKPGMSPTPRAEIKRGLFIKLIRKIAGLTPTRTSPQPAESSLIPKTEIKYSVPPRYPEPDPAKKDWIPKASFPYESKPQGTATERLRRAEKSGVTMEESGKFLKKKNNI